MPIRTNRRIALNETALTGEFMFKYIQIFLPNLVQSNELPGHGSNKLTDFEILALSQNKLDEYKDTFYPVRP